MKRKPHSRRKRTSTRPGSAVALSCPIAIAERVIRIGKIVAPLAAHDTLAIVPE